MNDIISEMKKTFQQLVEYSNEKKVYIDCNYIDFFEKRTVLDSTTISSNSSRDRGIKIRAWNGKFFEEESLDDLDTNLVLETGKKLIDRISIPQNYEELKLDEKKQDKEFYPENKIEDISISELTDKLDEIKNKILNLDDIVNVRVGFIKVYEKHLFINKFKTLFQEIPLNLLISVAFVKCDDGSVRTAYKSYVDETYDIFEKEKKEFNSFTNLISNIKKSKKLSGGKYKVVLSPHLSGLLAHESFGHGMEADTMMKDRALANSWIGKQIGSQNISIVDYPLIDGKNGKFYFDHEGNLAEKTYLVKNGIINEPMADLYSKTKLNLNKSNNARFESFDRKHYTRMSNTYFEKGNETVDELVSKVEDGIFIWNSSGGMEDPKGWGVQLQGCYGQKIKNGKLVDEFYDGFTLTGFLPDIIKNISGISKEFEIEGGGRCGKGHKDWVRVSEGGPYLLINEVILG